MGARVRAGKPDKYSDAASEGEFREWKHDEYADDCGAGRFGADEH